MRDRPEIDFHDDISSEWETLHRSRVFRSRTASMFGLLGQSDLGGQKWLDAGCGTGTLSRELAGRGCQVTGVDASSKMISVAKAQQAARPMAAQVDFREVTTIESLPFPDQSFDGVLCASVLEYVPDVERCLTEIGRVLRPGGLFLLSIPNRRSLLRQGFKFAHAVSSRLSPRPLFRYLEFSTFDTSSDNATSILQRHGFVVLDHSFAGSPLTSTLDRLALVGTLINILARRS